jgi:hypothetical protein
MKALRRLPLFSYGFAFVLSLIAPPGKALARPAAPTAAVEPDLGGGWFEQLWTLPLFRFFAPAQPVPAFLAPVPGPPAPACWVEPLPEITDIEALGFEAGVSVRTDGLTPETSTALDRFQDLVSTVGGNVILTSAYRPAAYQEHLQQLWDKWMLELRSSHEPECEALKAEVRDEFMRHELLESQRPVSISDHTRGLSFDAVVQLPRRARLNRRRVSVDRLARMSGIIRPAIATDPVHFRLAAAARI